MSEQRYRGRLAPSPTGYLHVGHARTFWIAQRRAEAAGGVLVLRNEDIDALRCQMQFVPAMMEDLRWFGFQWQEGPDCGGPFGPYSQGERRELYIDAFKKLLAGGFIYPCGCSRKDVRMAARAPHAGEEGPVYPGTCRNASPGAVPKHELEAQIYPELPLEAGATKRNWRFRVTDGEPVSFRDGCQGDQCFVAGEDFGDFVVWRNDGVPGYQLAVAVDDAAMQITEVVRGADLLLSTARQLLLYRALGMKAPAFYHCPLVTDSDGIRLAKRHDALSLRAFRKKGHTPQQIRDNFFPRGLL